MDQIKTFLYYFGKVLEYLGYIGIIAGFVITISILFTPIPLGSIPVLLIWGGALSGMAGVKLQTLMKQKVDS